MSFFLFFFLMIIQMKLFFDFQGSLNHIWHKVLDLQKQIRNADEIVKKNSSHIFGLKKIDAPTKVDLSYFNNILALNQDTITVESNVTIKAILDYLIPKGYILNVTPDMSHLTMGGIIAGVGGGSSTFSLWVFS